MAIKKTKNILNIKSTYWKCRECLYPGSHIQIQT